MKLGTTFYSDFENSGAMEALNEAQVSASAASAFLKMRDEQMLKAAEAMRRSLVTGIDASIWKQITGLQTSVTGVAKTNNLLSGISDLAGIGRIVPSKRVLMGFDFASATQTAISAQPVIRKAFLPRGLTEAIEQATKHLTASEQLLKQMQNLTFAPETRAALEEYSAALPDFEQFSAVSKTVGEHYRNVNIDKVLRRFQQLEKELNLDIPVETTDDIDDLVEDAEAIEFVEKQITEDGVLKPSLSQALFGFNLNELTPTQSGSLVVFCAVTLNCVHEVLSGLLDENATAARLFAVVIINFIAMYGSAMVADGELGKNEDSPVA